MNNIFYKCVKCVEIYSRVDDESDQNLSVMELKALYFIKFENWRRQRKLNWKVKEFLKMKLE